MDMTLIGVDKNERSYPKRPYEARRFNAKPRLYIDLVGENMLQNLINRKSRPVDLYRKLLPEIRTKLGLDPATKMTWSQKAGCGCGCSPGFIIDVVGGRWDAWARVSGPATADTPEAQALVQSRAQALPEGTGLIDIATCDGGYPLVGPGEACPQCGAMAWQECQIAAPTEWDFIDDRP